MPPIKDDLKNPSFGEFCQLSISIYRGFPIVSYGFPLVAYDLAMEKTTFFVGISQPATLMSASPCCGCQ